jgi:hypothetical protein
LYISLTTTLGIKTVAERLRTSGCHLLYLRRPGWRWKKELKELCAKIEPHDTVSMGRSEKESFNPGSWFLTPFTITKMPEKMKRGDVSASTKKNMPGAN